MEKDQEDHEEQVGRKKYQDKYSEYQVEIKNIRIYFPNIRWRKIWRMRTTLENLMMAKNLHFRKTRLIQKSE